MDHLDGGRTPPPMSNAALEIKSIRDRLGPEVQPWVRMFQEINEAQLLAYNEFILGNIYIMTNKLTTFNMLNVCIILNVFLF